MLVCVIAFYLIIVNYNVVVNFVKVLSVAKKVTNFPAFNQSQTLFFILIIFCICKISNESNFYEHTCKNDNLLFLLQNFLHNVIVGELRDFQLCTQVYIFLKIKINIELGKPI